MRKLYFWISLLMLVLSGMLVVFANSLVAKSLMPTDYFVLNLPTGEDYYCSVLGHDITCDWSEVDE